MINLAKTSDEVKAEKEKWDNPASLAYCAIRPKTGLSISLNGDTLKKLGLDGADLPPVGSVFEFSAKARITSVSSNDEESGDGTVKQRRSVEAQITDIEIPASAPQPRAARWYTSSAPPATDTTSDTDDA